MKGDIAIPATLTSMLILLCQIAKKNQTGSLKAGLGKPLIRCPGCHLFGGYVKHGFYERYLFLGAGRIKVQRYLCKNPSCETVTFSILPHPFLRYVRFPLCFLAALLFAHEVEGRSISSLAKGLHFSRGRVRRIIKRAEELKCWLFEINKEDMPWSRPCLSPPKRWTDFNRVFSWTIYPRRYGRFENNTI